MNASPEEIRVWLVEDNEIYRRGLSRAIDSAQGMSCAGDFDRAETALKARLVEAHCHELDVMDWAMKDHPRECNGMGGRTTLSSEPRFGEDYDHHFHEYTYADGTKMYSQSRTLSGLWAPISEHVHGDQGVIDLDGKIMKINAMGKRERTNPYHKE